MIHQKAGLCLAGFLLCCACVLGQYQVSGELLDVGNNFNDVKVELMQGEVVNQIPVSVNGSFYTSLDWNKIYYFSFKKTGYVTKVIEFSTEVPPNASLSSIEPYHMPVSLFEIFEGVDTVFFNNPVAKIRYVNNERRANGQLGDFADDRDYSLNVKYRIDQMRQEGAQRAENLKTAKEEHVITVMPPKSSHQVIVEPKGKEITKTEHLEHEGIELKTFVVEETNGTPPLKEAYPLGETVEEFDLRNRHVKRTIFVYDGQRRVFLSVKHDWGGHFFFIDEASIGYRCISKEMYEDSIVKCRTKLIVNK